MRRLDLYYDRALMVQVQGSSNPSYTHISVAETLIGMVSNFIHIAHLANRQLRCHEIFGAEK